MKKMFLILAFSFLTIYNLFGQTEQTKYNSQTTNNQSDINAYILGATENSKLSATIVHNGIKLLIIDSSFKVSSFTIVFEYDNIIYEFPCEGDSVDPAKTQFWQQLKKVKPGSILTVEKINLKKNGVNYRLPSLVYFIVE